MHTAAADQALGRNSSEAIRWVDEGRPEGLPFIHTKGKLINWHLSCGNHRLVIASPPPISHLEHGAPHRPTSIQLF